MNEEEYSLVALGKHLVSRKKAIFGLRLIGRLSTSRN
jgi:hypothetical protein